MKRLIQNIRLVEGIVALLFLVSCSGFSVILHSCLMEGMACCDRPIERSHMQTDALPNSISFGQTIQGCCHTIVAGGLNGYSALAERHNLIEHVKTAAIVRVTPVTELFFPPHISLHFLTHSGSPSPPSMGKFLLNSSLLI